MTSPVRQAANTYYKHHFGCSHCIAAGWNHNLPRCVIGSPLWRTYLDLFDAAQKEIAAGVHPIGD